MVGSDLTSTRASRTVSTPAAAAAADTFLPTAAAVTPRRLRDAFNDEPFR